MRTMQRGYITISGEAQVVVGMRCIGTHWACEIDG